MKLNIPKRLRRIAMRTLPGLVALMLGIQLATPIFQLAHYRDEQSLAYDQAMDALASDDPQVQAQAIGLLAQSIKSFTAARKTSDAWARFNFPQPDQELAALAYFHAANLLLEKDPKEALSAYVESLRLNSGQMIVPGASARDDAAHQYGRDFCAKPSDELAMHSPASSEECQLRRLQKEADDTRNNIMALLSKHPELAKELANPQGLKPSTGQSGKGSAQSGNKKNALPGEQPAPNHGHNEDHSI